MSETKELSNVYQRRPSLLTAQQVKRPHKNGMKDVKKELEINEHKLNELELCARFKTDVNKGLTQTYAEELLQKNGPNALTPPKKTPIWMQFLKQLTNGFAILLWLGAFFSIIAFLIRYGSDKNAPKDNVWLAVVLVLVVLITGCFQFYQEFKSGKILESFKNMLPEQALVCRDGKKQHMPAEQIVVGDLVHVETGSRIPADIRIIKSSGLKVDNSSLTGEAEPQSRSSECTHNNPLETKNLAFFSTFAVEGSGVGIVIRTGDNTAMGRIATLATGIEDEETHLAQEMRHFIHLVTVVAFTFGITFFIISIALGYQLVDSFVFLIGVVIANVPEGLMACLTVCLALTAKRMAKKNCLVKHLEAVEALGSIGIICSDKTGTLTMNRMTVSHMWIDNRIVRVNLNDPKDSCHAYENLTFTDEEISTLMRRRSLYEKTKASDIFDTQKSISWKMLMRCAMLCNRAEFKPDPENMAKDVMKRSCTGDASETAILQYSEHILGNVMKYRNEHTKVFEIPFNSTNKYQVSIHDNPEGKETGRLLVMKGAPERILEHCSQILINGEDLELTEEWRNAFGKSYDSLGGMGERVLGFCDKILDPDEYPKDYEFKQDEPDEFPPKDLRFLGFISMIDPPKPNVPEALHKCHTAGIRVFMVTGDHPITAKAIAKAVGIIKEETREDIAARLKVPIEQVNPKDAKAVVLHGTQLSQMNAIDLNNILTTHEEIVFARTSPQQKLLIVEACQRLGVLVGVTGDGVNDSPAMKKADIGISMGITGSDVSKQVADMVLLDDNFATIVTGVEEGRLIFDNISKIIQYTFTKNMTELTPFIMFILLNMPLALGTITILCVDLGTDIAPSLSLSYEKAENDIMLRKPRDLVKDKMTNSRLVSFCYGQIALIEAAAGFFAYSVCLAENGFFPSRAIGVRIFWDSPNINDLRDSYGAEWTYEQRKTLERACQTSFYVGIVVTQIANLLICKTKRESLVRHGFRNMQLNFSILFTIALACFIIYVPGLNSGLQLFPQKFLWWLTGIPFAVLIVVYSELIKYLTRKYPDTWFQKEFVF
jgi:sodium/potassium-transporting ATPase subunit alpha